MDSMPPPVPRLLAACDHRPGLLAARTRAGELVRVGRGLYMEPPRPDLPAWRRREELELGKASAAGLALPEHAYVGLTHAALLLGAPVGRFPADVSCFSEVPSSRAKGPTLYRRHRTRRPPIDRAIISGVPISGPLQTALDCARMLPPDQSLPIADSLLRRAAGLEDRDAARQRAADEIRDGLLASIADGRGIPGNARARCVIEHADARAESPIESQARRLALVLGLPRPLLQMPIAAGGRLFFPDMTWLVETPRGVRIIDLETDGMEKYTGDRRALVAERERARLLRQAGRLGACLTSGQIRHEGLENVRDVLFPLMPESVLAARHPVRGLMTSGEATRVDLQRPRRRTWSG